MLEQDNKELKRYIVSATEQINYIFLKLDEILRRPTRSFQIVFKGKEFKFFPPTTKKEQKAMEKQKTLFIKRLLTYVIKNKIKGLPYKQMLEEWQMLQEWGLILSFTNGVDPKDMEFERVEVPIETMQGEIVKQKPLNEESLYVQWQDQSIYPEIK